MTRLGLIARADSFSGLANQTHEVWRHLHPTRTLIVNLHERNRGPFRPGRFTSEQGLTRVTVGPTPTDTEIQWLVDGSDVVYSAECVTHPGLNRHCMETGTRLILHANPELYDPSYGEPPCEVWTATEWRSDLLPNARLVPFPVATDRFTVQPIEKVDTLAHIPAPAMLDRNGTELFRAARPLLRGRFWIEQYEPVDDYWLLWGGADALVLPRRYAGLCLTMQEAAASGMPIVMLQTDANAHRTLPELRVQVSGYELHPMKGGMVEVYDADPADLASCIDRLADPSLVKAAAATSRAWADEISWTRQLPEWRRLLRMTDED